MASSAPSTPRRRVHSAELIDGDDLIGFPSSAASGGGGNRSRLPSSEIPRTYSGLYGAGAPPMPEFGGDGSVENDVCTAALSPQRARTSSAEGAAARARHAAQQQSNLLPFELSRNRNTDWIAAGGPALLATYVFTIAVFLLTFLAFVTEPKDAWAMANVAHGAASMVYLHWIKGNPADYMDGTQGEMNGMTCWEQIVSKPCTHLHHATAGGAKRLDCSPGRGRGLRESAAAAIRKLRSRDVLCVVPTLLAHASCHVANYEKAYVLVNVGVWALIMVPKLPFMNGVRILGINRTAGIDDGDYLDDDDDDECNETEEDTSKDSAVGLDFNDDEPKKDR